MNLRDIASALNGTVSGDHVLAPGPNHSRNDRSMAVWIDASSPDGFLVHSFAGDDFKVCRDYVRERVGLPAWRPYIPSITAPTPRPIIRKSDQDREIADQERTERAMSSALTANGLQCIMERHRLELSYLLSAWPYVAPHAAAR
jgi:hypothetical protein